MKTVTVLGNNSGRNAGDNAILGNLLDDFAQVRQDIHFKVPTLNPAFIKKHFGHHHVTPIGLLPWNLAMKNFGWPMYRAMTQTDMVLITDNILFDRKFHNPFVNNLKSIALFSAACKKRGIPIIFYNASVGPIDHEVGKQALQKVLDASSLVITRDGNTKDLIEKLDLRHPEIRVHADCALNTPLPPQERIEEIIQKEDLFKGENGTIGLNVNAYIDDWSQTGTLNREVFCQVLAETADKLIETYKVDILFTVTQIMDMKITLECFENIKNKDAVRVVGNKDYTFQEIAALLQRLELHAGLRTHTLIFCASVNTPMLSINAYPKSSGFMRTVGQGDWCIDFENLSVENLTGLIGKLWDQRATVRETMKPLVDAEKQKARDSVAAVSELLGT